MTIPKPPDHLQTEGKAAWRRFHRLYDLKPDHREILLELCEATDRKREAQEAIKRDGLTLEDRFKQQRPNPAVGVERDCRLQILRCLRALGLPAKDDRTRAWSGGRKPRGPVMGQAEAMRRHEEAKRRLAERRT